MLLHVVYGRKIYTIWYLLRRDNSKPFLAWKAAYNHSNSTKFDLAFQYRPLQEVHTLFNWTLSILLGVNFLTQIKKGKFKTCPNEEKIIQTILPKQQLAYPEL